MAGKISQSLRDYTKKQGGADFALEKFVINSIISATHTSDMEESDRNDIIKKINKAGANKEENGENDNGGNNNSDNTDNNQNKEDDSQSNSQNEAIDKKIELIVEQKIKEAMEVDEITEEILGTIGMDKNGYFHVNDTTANPVIKRSIWRPHRNQNAKTE